MAAFEELTNKWRQVGLAAFQRTALLSDAAAISTNREALVQGRKTLSLDTKAFARLTQEEKVAEFPALLKKYQAYIDDLTKFTKVAEKGFFDLHDFVAALSDPAPLMEKFAREKSVIVDFAKSHEALAAARAALAEREAELSELKNQEVTINNLREQLAASEIAAVRSAEAEASSEQLRDVLHEWQRREQGVQQQLTTMSQECRRFQLAAAELQTQLAAARAHAEERDAAAEHDAEALLAELRDLQATNHVLLRQLDDARAAAAASATPQQTSRDREALLDADGEAAALSEARDLRERVKELEHHAGLLERDRAALQSRLAESAAAADAGRRAEAELLQLRADVATARRELRAAESRANGSEAELEGARAEANAYRAQAADLKATVARLQQALQATERELRDEVRRAAAAAPPSSQQQQQQQQQSDGATPPAAAVVATPPPIPDADEMMAALATQRDRYRQRLFALEDATSREMERLKAQIVGLQRDNAALTRTGGGASAAAGHHSDEAMLESEHRAVRIHSLLENSHASLVPQFLDRTAVLLARFVLANQVSRRVFLAYLVGVHALVFIVLLERFLTDT